MFDRKPREITPSFKCMLDDMFTQIHSSIANMCEKPDDFVKGEYMLYNPYRNHTMYFYWKHTFDSQDEAEKFKLLTEQDLIDMYKQKYPDDVSIRCKFSNKSCSEERKYDYIREPSMGGEGMLILPIALPIMIGLRLYDYYMYRNEFVNTKEWTCAFNVDVSPVNLCKYSFE